MRDPYYIAPDGDVGQQAFSVIREAIRKHIVGTKRGDFEPGKFQDNMRTRYKELIEKKVKGEKIERPKEPARTNVVNLMDALRQSIKAEGGSAPRKVGRTDHRAPKKAGRASGRQKKAS